MLSDLGVFFLVICAFSGVSAVIVFICAIEARNTAKFVGIGVFLVLACAASAAIVSSQHFIELECVNEVVDGTKRFCKEWDTPTIE